LDVLSGVAQGLAPPEPACSSYQITLALHE